MPWVNDAKDKSLNAALNDVVAGIALKNVWWNFAVYDTVSKYRRTVLGPLWNSLTVVVIVGILALVWSTIFSASIAEFLPRMSIGYITWWLISGIVTGSTGVFSGVHRAIILNTAVPKSAMVLRHVVSSFLSFLHHLLPLTILFVAMRLPVSGTMLLVVPGLIAIFLAALPTTFILGALCARFRDVQVLVNTIMGIGIMISPVMWDIDRLGQYSSYAYLNPFTAFIHLVKLPAIGQVPTAADVYAVLGTCVFLWGTGIVLFARYRSRIALWV